MTAVDPVWVLPPPNPLAPPPVGPVEMLPAWDAPDLPNGFPPGDQAPCPQHPDAAVDPMMVRGHPWLVLEYRTDTVAISLHHCSHALPAT